jgi:hypothetical protein
MAQIPSQKMFVSMCKELQLHIWGFESGKPKKETKYRTY